MEFSEIEEIVRYREDVPEHASLLERYTYCVLQDLYERRMREKIDQKQAVLERKNIMALFSEERQKELQRAAMYKQYQYQLKRAGSLLNAISKGHRAGKKPEELFRDAIRCISALTDDKTLLTRFDISGA